MNVKLIQWILRIAVAGEYVGHGVFALQKKQAWINWFPHFGISTAAGAELLPWIGALDLLVALIILIKPIRIALLWAALWGFWTALIRPIVGEPIWDFVERWANWGAPLALLLLRGRFPKTWHELFT